MLRAVLLAALALSLVLPSAAALPIPGASPNVSAAVGPDGLTQPEDGEPYYLWATATRPTPPHPSRDDKDCAAGARPDPETAASELVTPVLAWEPLTNIGFSGWFPQCMATEISAVCTPDSPIMTTCQDIPGEVYASYDVTNGSYHIRANVPTPLGLKPSTHYEGSTGVGLLADCQTCPQPP